MITEDEGASFGYMAGEWDGAVWRRQAEEPCPSCDNPNLRARARATWRQIAPTTNMFTFVAAYCAAFVEAASPD